MRCEDLKIYLPLYADDALDETERAAIERHLPTCPLCRQEADEYRELKLGLRSLGNPEMPKGFMDQIIASIPVTARETGMFSSLNRRVRFGERLSHWLMPFGVGAAGSVAVALLFLSVMFVRPATGLFGEPVRRESTVEVASVPFSTGIDSDNPGYLRIEIPENSPEVNPTGALVALTRSIVRGNMSDAEVVVVADVFGNGIANIAEVVEPPDDEEGMRELERAFRTEPDQAPFLPARISRNSDAVRVVLKIQRVDVP